MTDEEFMEEALKLAEMAKEEGEVPVGAVVVWDGKIVGRGRNTREKDKNALGHAELAAINEACRTLGGWRLWKGDLYVTLEPCPMCAGAIINSRIRRVIYGADDIKNGAAGSVVDLFNTPMLYHPSVTKGVLKEKSSNLLTEFFNDLRRKTEDL